jgi:sedoheptulokinase
MACALGLDIGTTSLAAVAVDQSGKLCALATAPNGSAVAGLPAGRAEQDPAVIRSSALDLLGRVARVIPEPPVCLGLTGQMHGVLLADAGLRPLTTLISWQDRRANEPAPGGGTLLEACLRRCPAEGLADNGCRPAPGYGIVTLYCLREQNELPAGDWKALTVADWLAAVLCGGPLATDRTLAASMGALSLRQDRWSAEILAATGADPAWMPDIRPSGSRLGGLRDDFAATTGLPPGLPVCVAAGDQQAAFLGSVPPGGEVLSLNIGTGGQISWELNRLRPVAGMEVRPMPTRGFLAVGAGVSGGDAYAWLQRTVAGWLRPFGISPDPETIYATINALAAAAPQGAGGLHCKPSFRGTRQAPLARGSFTGVSERNFDLGSLARAVLEGIVETLHAFYEGAGEAAPSPITRIIASGNAFDRNPLLGRIAEGRFDSPIWRAAEPEAAARGAALLAGAGHGVWNSLDTARAAVRLQRMT